MKKTIKKISNNSCYICSRKHKIFAWIALVGIFLCGMMTGVSLWGYKHVHTPNSAVQKEYRMKKLQDLNSNRTCEAVEEVLLRNIQDGYFEQNFRIYKELVNKGCQENKAQFIELAAREQELYNAVNDAFTHQGERPCEVIERQLFGELATPDNPSSWEHSRNAKVYSQMAEDGCPENTEKYKQMALNELQIADGIKVRDDSISHDEMRYTVGTYKKLQMQNEAKKYIKKVEKLVNPGIDFIMELQRVIEE